MTARHWNIDTAHSGIHFTVRHMVFSRVRGSFGRWRGVVDWSPEEPAGAKVSVRIDAASVDTREPKRDEHLRSADFLDVERHPDIAFDSTEVVKLAGERYRVIGDLTIAGTARRVELDAEYLGRGVDPWGNQRIGFHARATIRRVDFGLTWNQVLETGGVLVGDAIEIAIDVQAIAAQAVEKVA